MLHRVSSRRTRVWALVVAVASALSLIGVAPPARADRSSDAAYLFSRINEARYAAGLPELVRNPDADRAAQSWAERMSRSRTSSHNPRLEEEMPPSGRRGEVVGDGYNIEVIFQSWQNSPSSSGVILDEGFTDIGVGVAYFEDRIYAVADLMSPPPPPPAPPAAEGEEGGEEEGGGPTGTPLDEILALILG